MEEQKKVELIKNNGTKSTIDLISLFKIKKNDTEKDYALLTANEVDQNGLIKILAAEVKDGKLERIADQGDWTLVKNVMRSIISSSKGDFNYINLGDVALSYVVDDNFARIIAVQEAAKMQLIKDYEANKPEVKVVKEPVKEPVKDPNEIIYPQNEEAKADNEVIPGISEADAKVDVKNADASNVPDENTIFNQAPVEKEEPQNLNSALENAINLNKDEFVSKVEETPLKDMVTNTALDSTSKNSDARKKLIEAIENAVDEYLNSVKEDSLEIATLKTNINVMQEQLDSINKALNTQE